MTCINSQTREVWPEIGPIAINHPNYTAIETQAITGLEVHSHEFDIESVMNIGFKNLWDKVDADIPASERYTREQAGLVAIARNERTLLANQAPFQRWLLI